MDRAQVLARIGLFSALGPEDLLALAEHACVRHVPRNSLIIQEGERSDSLFAIVSGRVRIFLTNADGREAVLNIQGQGEYFGELALIDDSPRSASVMTVEPCELMVITKADFERCMYQRPDIAILVMRDLTGRIRGLSEQVRSLALLDVYGRVARLLLDLASPAEEDLVIDERLTHQEIASRVGSSREMVSRIMKDLTAGGYISVEQRRIRIHNQLPARW